jgi:hypothetical protein
VRPIIDECNVKVIFRQYESEWTTAILFRETCFQDRGAMVVWVGVTDGAMQEILSFDLQNPIVQPLSEFNIRARVLRQWGSPSMGILQAFGYLQDPLVVSRGAHPVHKLECTFDIGEDGVALRVD